MLDDKSVRKIAIAAGVITLAICATIVAATYWSASRPVYVQYNTGTDGKPVNNISVAATGKISVTPDIATFTAGYSVKKSTIAAVQKDLQDRSNQITAALKAQGVADKDIQTSYFNITPSYRWDWTSGKRIDEGHQGDLALTVKVRDIKKTGEIIDKAVDAGANTVTSITFSIDDLEGARSTARDLAAKAAKTKAGELANGSGVSLGGLVSISETSYDYQPIYYNSYRDLAAEGSKSTSTPTSISAGSLEIAITVNATYGIR